MSENRERSSPAGRQWFSTTRWSIVLAAGDSQSSESREALAMLCQSYWPPVYSYIRYRGHDADTAQDLAQGFFTQLLEKNYLKDVRRERGRFRSFLLTAVKHYLSHEREKAQAKKRGGGATPIPLDLDDAESRYGPKPGHDETPEKIFEKRWVRTLLDRVLRGLETEMAGSGNVERFKRFKPFLTVEGSGQQYKHIAAELGMTEAAIKVAIHRLRRRFGDLLRSEVAETVDDDRKVEDEIRFLFSVMAS